MSCEWRWRGALVAISAGDKYFESAEAHTADGVERYASGDGVYLDEGAAPAVICALWEAPDGTAMAEVRRLYHLSELPKHVQAQREIVCTAALRCCPEKLTYVWESTRLETVALARITERVRVIDPSDRVGQSPTKQKKADYFILGIYDEEPKRLRQLPSNSSYRQRSRQLSARARQLEAPTITTDASNNTVIGHKRGRQDDEDTVDVNTDPSPTAPRPPQIQKALDKLHKACEELLLSHAPDRTTAREDEFAIIHEHLHTAINGATSNGALYISGLPGTGKTSIVREVILELELEREHGVLPAFVFTEVNGLHLPKPEGAYSAIWQAVMGVDEVPRSLGPARLCQSLAHEFEHGNPGQRPVVLAVLDEMDFLVAGKSVVLYNILEWQTLAKSKLVVVGIANTMDLPERLEQKVRSRLGSNRLIFSSYTGAQLERIVRQRMGTLDIFSEDAIHVGCKYVAQASGDARQVLTLCRRAAEVAIHRLEANTDVSVADVPLHVTAQDLQDAQLATSVSAPLIRLRDCRKFECVFLVAVSMEVKRSNREEADFENVLRRFAILCNTHSLIPVPRLRDLLVIGEELDRSGILRQLRTKTSRYPKLMLRCSPQEIQDVFVSHPIGRKLYT